MLVHQPISSILTFNHFHALSAASVTMSKVTRPVQHAIRGMSSVASSSRGGYSYIQTRSGQNDVRRPIPQPSHPQSLLTDFIVPRCPLRQRQDHPRLPHYPSSRLLVVRLPRRPHRQRQDHPPLFHPDPAPSLLSRRPPHPPLARLLYIDPQCCGQCRD